MTKLDQPIMIENRVVLLQPRVCGVCVAQHGACLCKSCHIRKTPCLLFGAISTFFMLFMKNVEKAPKRMNKPSPPLARVLSKAVKKVYCFQKYSRSQKYMKVQLKNDK